MLNLINRYITSCVERGLSKKTYGSYEQALMLFSRYLKDECNIHDFAKVKDRHVKNYINYLRERGKYTTNSNDLSKEYNHPDRRTDYGKRISDTTINNYIRNLKVFYNWGTSSGCFKENPVLKVPQIKVARRALEFLSDEEFKRLIISMDTSRFTEYRDFIIIQLLLDTGMRIGECLLIKSEDVSFRENAIYLRAENTKGKRGRYVFFSEKLGTKLRRWLQYQDRYRNSEYIFPTSKGKSLEIGCFETNLRKYAQKAKVKHVHPHMFRNNFAKRYLMNGGDIYSLSRILGHSSVQVTENSYLDLDTTDLMRQYRTCSPLVNMGL